MLKECAYIGISTVNQLDSWVLQRCPMFHEGCNFNLMRWKPGPNDSFTFNGALQSFAIRSDINGASSDQSDDSDAEILRLPAELLDSICAALDSASLYCVSLTCKVLRKVAASQLLAKGFVENSWTRTVRSDGKIEWVPGVRRWRFGTIFSYSRHWQQQLVSSMGDHIARCPCYEPYIHTEDRVKVIFSP